MSDATAAPAARVGDPTGHPGAVGPPGVLSVLIGGKPAATVGTAHLCSSPAAHPPTVLAPPGSATVFIGGQLLPPASVTWRAAAPRWSPAARPY